MTPLVQIKFVRRRRRRRGRRRGGWKNLALKFESDQTKLETNLKVMPCRMDCPWCVCAELFLKKMGQPRPLFVYFRSFQTNNTIFTTNQCEKMSIQ